MSNQQSQLGAFIHSCRGRVARFELFRKTSRIQGSKFDPIRPYDFEDSTGVDELAALVITHAQDDVNEIGTPGAFVLSGEDEAGQVVAKKEFRIGTISAGGPLDSLERHEPGPNDGNAVIAMLMRHLEVRERTSQLKDAQFFKAQEAMQTSYQMQIDRLSASLDKKEEREIMVIETFERLTSQVHARDLEAKKADQLNALAERTIKQVEPVIPAFINKIMGVPLIPLEHQESFDTFLYSMTEEQLDVIRSTLTPEQQGVLGMMATESAKRRAQRDAQKAAKNASKGEANA